jgi:hypothetical protein
MPDCSAVRDQAANTFRGLNKRKGWGCPEKEIRTSLEQRSDLGPEERAVLWLQQVKRWFAENEHRFPAWKLGDPLPESPAGENNPAHQ